LAPSSPLSGDFEVINLDETLPPPQFAFNTLQRVSPVAHGVCNVVKRVAIIFSSVFFFNQVGGYCFGGGSRASARPPG
jgi:hypothetical protein